MLGENREGFQMKILVSASSRHGSTKEVAEALSQRLRERGFEVEQKLPEDVTDISDYSAVVVGSSVYLRQWSDEAKDFVSRFHKELRDMPSWAFSVGMSGVSKSKPKDIRRIGPVAVDGVFDGQEVFDGRYDPTALNLRERSIGYVGGAVEGDYRDWDKIRAYADRIADTLQSES